MNWLLNTSRKGHIVQIPSNGSHCCKLDLACIAKGGVKWLKKLDLLQHSFVSMGKWYWVGLKLLVWLDSAINFVNTIHDVLKLLRVELAVVSWAADVLLVLEFFKHTSAIVYRLICGIYMAWTLENFWQKMVATFYKWKLISRLCYFGLLLKLSHVKVLLLALVNRAVLLTTIVV